MEKAYPNEGHRKRLRTRFLQSGLDGFLDYEIIELLLTLNTPRRDCKQSAKKAIKRFGSLRNVLDAPIEDLQTIKGIGPANIFGLKLFHAVSEKYLKEQIPKKIDLSSSKLVAAYLQGAIGKKDREYFLAVFLDSRNCLIKTSNISIGSLNSSIVHPRELFKEAIKSSSSQIIIAHNHPSDDSKPSPQDIALTRRLQDVAMVVGIEIIDHIVVTRNEYFSFKENRLI